MISSCNWQNKRWNVSFYENSRLPQKLVKCWDKRCQNANTFLEHSFPQRVRRVHGATCGRNWNYTLNYAFPFLPRLKVLGRLRLERSISFWNQRSSTSSRNAVYLLLTRSDYTSSLTRANLHIMYRLSAHIYDVQNCIHKGRGALPGILILEKEEREHN